MSNINLLPWREARALRQKKQFGAMLGIFLAITGLVAQIGELSVISVI